MNQKITCFFLMILCLSVSSVNNVEAQSRKIPDPYIKKTEQWSVQIDDPIFNKQGMAKPKPGIANMYSVVIKNTGETLHNVIIEGYRNDPESPTKFGLFSTAIGKVASGVEAFSHSNLPVSIRANNIEIVISWQDNPKAIKGQTIEGRKYKQTFTFAVNQN
ncbi:hypothetical protein [Paenibacillus spongiae]|uniref:Uncharacterized protein n=1 Tax=Paenibacillus spongiae TaxID=2909671 RepID=A0ABY5S5N7_9BACL|nr:hypothetical protein [Paenibacillus spongiae]UVI28182.1 hypothetical protein L1F29_22355 [Paenibacillus spongiae]